MQCYAVAVYAVALCQCVLQARTVLKQLNIGSSKQCHIKVAQGL